MNIVSDGSSCFWFDRNKHLLLSRLYWLVCGLIPTTFSDNNAAKLAALGSSIAQARQILVLTSAQNLHADTTIDLDDPTGKEVVFENVFRCVRNFSCFT